MKKKIKAIVSLFAVFLFCMPMSVFATINESNDLIYTKMDEAVPGYNAIVENGNQRPIGTQVLAAGSVERRAYCVDALFDLRPGHHYSTLNLEDAYFGIAVAKRVRAILTNSFPFVSMATLETRTGTRYSEREAITATQLAIWQITNGKNYGIYVNPDIGQIARINTLKAWYLNLQGTSAKSTIANIEIKSTFTGGILDIAYRADQNNSDGTPILLTCGVEIGMDTQNGETDAEGYRHMLVKNPTRPVSVDVGGKQRVHGDVYLFQPDGERAASQCLAGFTDKEASIQKTLTIPLVETPPATQNGIKITKIDSATQMVIPNVSFLLSQSSAFIAPNYTITTNAQGIAEKTELAIGTWYIKEVMPPANYMPVTDAIAVSVGTGITELTIKNTPYSGVKILKVDEDQIPLPGAKFSIYAGAAVGEPLYKDLVTDEQGILLQGNLTAGEYTLVETFAPIGHTMNPAPISINLLPGETKTISFTNISIKGKMEILKFDSVSKERLAGAKFSIYKDALLQQEVAKVTSLLDAPAVIDSLKPGLYYVQETEVPPGYLIDHTVKTVTIDFGKTTVVEFFNTRALPTAGNYATLLIVGSVIMSVCVLGWVGFLFYKKREK